MTKHLADHRTPADTPRRKHFWALERRGEETKPHPAIRSLSQRPIERTNSARLAQFLRIERGETA